MSSVEKTGISMVCKDKESEVYTEQQVKEFNDALLLLKIKDKRHKYITAILAAFMLFVIGSAAYFYFLFNKEINLLHTSQAVQYEKHIETNQFLLSTLEWSSKRSHMILFMRDQIVGEWKRCGVKVKLEKAYVIAERNMIECEKYPHLDPFFILAMQNVESAFNEKATSSVGACGLNQLMPSTAKLLCGFFGIQYADSLLHNVKTGTMLAVKLLDVLYSQYNGDLDLVLSDYNGGPYQAFYYKNNKNKLAEETAMYVPKVQKIYKDYHNQFKIYKIDKEFISRIK